MNEETYISPVQIKRQYSISSNTLRVWANDGKIKFIRPNGTKRLYNKSDIQHFLGVEKEQPKKGKLVCYARVSSSHQRKDLERQVQYLQEKFPEAKIYKDIGSGLNWKRQGFISLLESIHKGDISTVVVTYRDRLCRFGYELLEWIFKKANVELLVLSKDTMQEDRTKELAEDLLAITTVFVAKNNGLRAGQYRRERRQEKDCIGQENGEDKTETIQRDYSGNQETC